MPDGRLRVLIIQHEAPTPPGLLVDWLKNLGAEVHLYRIDSEDRVVDVGEFDLIVSLGSEFAAFDDSIAWLHEEMDIFRDAGAIDVPILGICFGGQLLARVHGGAAYRGEVPEVGWLPVRRIGGKVPEGPWFQWHFDTFSLPPGADLLADSDAGPQAFVLGRSMGVQFHPEVTPKIMEEWIRMFRHELDAEGVNPDELLAETKRLTASTRSTAFELLDWFAGTVAKLGVTNSDGR